MLNTIEAIGQRRSVRAFLPDEAPEATLHEIFTLAQQAPSNCNTQPWIVHVREALGVPEAHKLLLGSRSVTRTRPHGPSRGRGRTRSRPGSTQ